MRRGRWPWGRLFRWPRGLSGFVLLAVASLPFSQPLEPPPPEGAPPPPEVRAATWNPVLPQEASGSTWALSLPPSSGGLTLRNGATWGLYNSSVHEADFPFNAVALAWRARTPPGSQVVLEVRASPDGQEWSEWFIAEPLDGWAVKDDEYRSQLVVARGRYLQYSATLYAADPELPPRLEDVKITYIDSTQGPSVTQLQPVGALSLSALTSQPAIISRAGWGSPEPYSSDRWPPEYREWQKVIVHDTQTKNDDPAPAVTVRAIWYYHANTLGWGDIGYNYLIDQFGNIYEGRFGGENVTGGHALPCYNYGSIGVALLGKFQYVEMSDAMEEALVSLLAWQTYRHRIDPKGSSYFGERWLPNIFGHRDVRGSCGNTHTDPGDYAYNRLPAVRDTVLGRFPLYGQEWLGHDTPSRMMAGGTASVDVTVRNLGGARWSSPSFRLGYRWYRPDGARVVQEEGDQLYSDLPAALPFGHSVLVKARVTAPRAPGTYVLRWDMVRDGVTWLGEQGAPTLNVTVQVAEPTYEAEFVAQSPPLRLFAGDRKEAWFELRNVGTATWQRSSPPPVKLGTWNPPDRASALATAGDWETPGRATYLDQEKVLPGQVGRFTFLVTGATQPGLYREYFKLVAEGRTWFGPDMYVDFSVLPTIKTFLPRASRAYGGGW